MPTIGTVVARTTFRLHSAVIKPITLVDLIITVVDSVPEYHFCVSSIQLAIADVNMHAYAINYYIDDRPGLTQLQQLHTRKGKPVRLLQDIAPRYAAFGTCLLADENGVKMSAINNDHRSVEEKTTAIFTKFLEGEITLLYRTCILTSLCL